MPERDKRKTRRGLCEHMRKTFDTDISSEIYYYYYYYYLFLRTAHKNLDHKRKRARGEVSG